MHFSSYSLIKINFKVLSFIFIYWTWDRKFLVAVQNNCNMICLSGILQFVCLRCFFYLQKLIKLAFSDIFSDFCQQAAFCPEKTLNSLQCRFFCLQCGNQQLRRCKDFRSSEHPYKNWILLPANFYFLVQFFFKERKAIQCCFFLLFLASLVCDRRVFLLNVKLTKM